MKTKIIRASQRGHFNYDWLDTYYTFSFGEYYNSQMMNFGMLRVFNDDIILPQTGFPMHPHKNMEIITVILDGVYCHEDNFGNKGQLNAGEVQVITAGSGILHSGTNQSYDTNVNLFQIWVLPKTNNLSPRYEQLNYARKLSVRNQWHKIVMPEVSNETLSINQDVYLSMGNFSADVEHEYLLNQPTYGVFLTVVEGSIEINNEVLNSKDSIMIEGATEINFTTLSSSKLLVIETIMN